MRLKGQQNANTTPHLLTLPPLLLQGLPYQTYQNPPLDPEKIATA
jgi:hypothetical protein